MKHTNTQPHKNRMFRHVAGVAIIAVLALSVFIFNSCEEESGIPGGPAPVITSFTPESGAAGTEVTINGSNFNSVISILFNGVKGVPKSKTNTQIVVPVPAGASTGKIMLTYGAGNAQTTSAFTVAFKQILVSDFEEENIASVWGVSEDATEITKSEFLKEGTNTYFHLKGADNNHNHWVGGRYKGTGNPEVHLGVAEKDASKVFFNVDVKNNELGSGEIAQAKLVFYVYDAAADTKKMNWEIDFPVNWTEWKTVSVAASKFQHWNDVTKAMDKFTGDISTVSEVALYLKGYAADFTPAGGPDFSFDNVRFSEGAALGTIVVP